MSDFWNWIKYKLRLTDWKKEQLIITYYTKRGSKAYIQPTGFQITSETQEAFIDKVEVGVRKK